MLEKPKSKGSTNLLPKYQNPFNCIFFVCNCNCRTIFLFCTCPNLLLICWLYLIVFYSFADCVCVCECVCVCVCVCLCLCLCLCLCVFIFFHREGFFRLQDVQDILERDGPTIFCCEYLYGCFCQVPSSPCLKVLNFTSKGENSSLQHTGEKTICYIHGQLKDDIDWYRIQVGPELKSTSDEKVLKIRRLL